MCFIMVLHSVHKLNQSLGTRNQGNLIMMPFETFKLVYVSPTVVSYTLLVMFLSGLPLLRVYDQNTRSNQSATGSHTDSPFSYIHGPMVCCYM